MSDKKYVLLSDDTVQVDGVTLYRVKAVKSFCDVSEGDLGGYIEKESNLDHTGIAWVYEKAKVFSKARVFGNAQVFGIARVGGEAKVYEDARVYGYAWVYGKAQIYGDAEVYGDACVRSLATIEGSERVFWASNVGTENGTLTVFNGKDGLIVTRGCFTGTVDEFLLRSAEVHDGKTRREYQLLIDVAKSRILG